MRRQDGDWPAHALNNLLCKIIGSAELALDRITDRVSRRELEAIIDLAESGARVVNSHGGQPHQQG